MAKKKTKRQEKSGLIEIKKTVTFPDGTKKRKSFYGKSKLAVNKAYDDFVARLYTERAPEPGSIPFKALAEEWLETYKRDAVRNVTLEKTYESPLNRHILPYFGTMLVARITETDIKKFYSDHSRFSHSYLSKMRVIIKSVLDLAVRKGIIQYNPAEMIKLPKASSDANTPKRAYSKQEAQIVVNYAKTHKYGLDVLLLLKTGMRRGELLALRWSDVDLKNQIIHVRQSVSETKYGLEVAPCKTKKSVRDIPFDGDVKSALNKARSLNQYVLSDAKGGIIRPSNWQHRRYSAFMRDFSETYSNIPVLNAHELRHTFGSILYSHGVDIVTISKLMGHSSIDVTVKIYVHDDIDMMREAVSLGV